MKTGRGGPCPPKTGGCDTLRLPASCPHCHWGVNPLPAPPAPPDPESCPHHGFPALCPHGAVLGGTGNARSPGGAARAGLGPGHGDSWTWVPPTPNTPGQERGPAGAPPNLHPKGPWDRRAEQGVPPQTSIPRDPRTGEGTGGDPLTVPPKPPSPVTPGQEGGPGGDPKTFIPSHPGEGTQSRRGGPGGSLIPPPKPSSPETPERGP